MAPFGQAASQALHSMQSCGLATTALLSTMSKTLAGQTSAQAPTPLHLDLSTVGGISVHRRLFEKGTYITCDSVAIGFAQVGEKFIYGLSVAFEVG